MRRRTFMIALGAVAAWSFGERARAQRMVRIGYLAPTSREEEMRIFAGHDPFREGLLELGYVEGKTVEIEARYAEGHEDQLKALADELVAKNVDVIVTYATGLYAAHDATRTSRSFWRRAATSWPWASLRAWPILEET
jgi:putative tryptophan/tyrosine transport system substrate-binding protein